MMHEYTPGVPSGPVRIGIVAARFNQFITQQLLDSAIAAFQANGIGPEQLELAWVPGAYELPLAADMMLEHRDVDGVLALGAVIKGGTPHFDYVAGECARGLSDVGLKRGRPVSFGVLTTDTVEQALERAAEDQGNKGFDVAMALMNMIELRDQFEKRNGVS